MNATSGKLRGMRCLLAARFAVPLLISLSFGKTEVPVFLFSGQSNMVGIGSVGDLTTDQKKTINNIMINIDGNCDQAKKGKWLPLGPGFGNGASNFGPELIFGKTLADSMPGRKIAFIKYAINGAPLGTSSGFLPPSSNNGTGGKNYSDMMTHVDKAMKSFSSVFDTSEYSPRWSGFIWLQGESDAMQGGGLAEKYKTNLRNLIADIRGAFKTPDMPVIIPLITTSSMWKECAKIREAGIALTKELQNVDTVETKEFYLPDNMHYNAEGLIKIGRLAALRWLAMKYNYKDVVPVVHHCSGHPVNKTVFRAASRPADRFDLLGRTFIFCRNETGQQRVSQLIFIGKSKQFSDRAIFQKAVEVR